jgi:hypothetical protein
MLGSNFSQELSSSQVMKIWSTQVSGKMCALPKNAAAWLYVSICFMVMEQNRKEMLGISGV